jgi:hypothetical protein
MIGPTGARCFFPLSLRGDGILVQIAILIVGGLLFTLYSITLAPTITWGHEGADSGELAAAVMTLGVAHPPGYPAYMVIGWLWLRLPLEGDPAYRLNLLSAVSAVIAVGGGMATIALIAPPLSTIARQVGVLFGGMLLGTLPLLWSQATITEVYTPGLAIIAWVSYAVCRWYLSGESGWWIGAWWGVGFGTGVLPQTALLLPGMVLLYLMRPQTRAVQWTLLRKGGIALAIGLLIFIYLPLRAATAPFINWGNPDTVDRGWAHLTARQYHHLGFQQEKDIVGRRATDALVTGSREVGWMSGLFVLPGIICLWRVRRMVLGYFGLMGGIALCLYAVYAVDRSSPYLLPAFYSASIVIGVGIATGCTMLMNRWGRVGVGITVVALTAGVAMRLWVNFPQMNVRHDDRAITYARTLLTALPPFAILVSNHDECTFPLWYQQALGERPDIMVVDSRLLFYPWYQHQLAQRHPQINVDRWYPGGVQAIERPLYTLPAFISDETDYAPCSIDPLKQ